MILENEKQDIEDEVSFILREKTKKDKERIFSILCILIAHKSHEAFKHSALYNFSGHIVRKNYRADLIKYTRKYLDLLFKK